MIVLTGLGNPGAKYAGHRHNIGFILLDEIHQRYEFSPWRSKHNAALSDGRIGTRKILLIKPMAYMNKSGLPVKDAMAFYKTAPDQLIVAHDDIDLAPGKVRVKMGGGHGGHNGLRDIDRHLGPNYRRIKIGVGRSPFATPDDKQVDTHVLSDFGKDELQHWVNPLIDCMASEIDRLFGDDDNEFMTTVARLCPPPTNPRDPKEE
ncbi:MAG: aminoacyl-tRNA hydrolase [Alphaproteobacteria bacterium]|nr:aminoacyl-tRNA hydrolase [Alphaproteobacteria bacterium]